MPFYQDVKVECGLILWSNTSQPYTVYTVTISFGNTVLNDGVASKANVNLRVQADH